MQSKPSLQISVALKLDYPLTLTGVPYGMIVLLEQSDQPALVLEEGVLLFENTILMRLEPWDLALEQKKCRPLNPGESITITQQ